MKPSDHYIIQLLRTKVRRTLVNLRQGNSKRRETCVQEEIGVGALVGCSACIAMAWNFSPLIVSVAAMIGLCSGAAIGLVLWVASVMLPDERIIPPAKGEKRSQPVKPDSGRTSGEKAFPCRYGGNQMKPRSKFRHSGHPASPQGKLLLHFKRDEMTQPSTGQETKGPRQVIEQAARDISRGLRDTDLHGIPSNVPGPGPDPEHSPGAEVVISQDRDSKAKPRKQNSS